MTSLTTCNVTHKRVFLRIDGNVPINNGTILNDFRLRAVLPTIDYLLDADATITIGTHLGRPTGTDPQLSVEPIRHWFAEKNLAQIKILENLRFDPREKKCDISFARQLASGQDVYINDAWGALHRDETSITVLPTLFAREHRAFGLLVEQELAALTPLRTAPKKPYVVFLGGGKQKFEALYQLAKQGHATTIVLLPGIVFTFLAAQGVPVGNSLVFPEYFDTCRAFMELARKNGITVLIPQDFFAGRDNQLILTGPAISDSAQGVTIGPKTSALLEKISSEAQTIFYNGAMGFGEYEKESEDILEKLLTSIALSHAHTVIGGGDSVAAAEKFGLAQKYTWCSTGGGSTLAFISGAELPGLQ